MYVALSFTICVACRQGCPYPRSRFPLAQGHGPSRCRPRQRGELRAPDRPGQAPPWAIVSLDAEDALQGAGYGRIAGLDEVGRGCWAGPVYVAAVIPAPECHADRTLLAEVTDSKRLTPTRRSALAADILDLALGVTIAWAEAPMIDRLNILGATRWAMRAALERLSDHYYAPPARASRGHNLLCGDAVMPGLRPHRRRIPGRSPLAPPARRRPHLPGYRALPSLLKWRGTPRCAGATPYPHLAPAGQQGLWSSPTYRACVPRPPPAPA